MKVMIFVDHFYPGYRAGGPLRLIANVLQTAPRSSRLRVVTSDRDLGDNAPYANIETDTWRDFANGSVRYVSPERAGLKSLVDLIVSESPEVIHLNSFFSKRFTLKILLAKRLGRLPAEIRIVISPHGEFAPAALQIKNTKKSMFMKLAKLTGLYRGVIWHATSPHEEVDIRTQGLTHDSEIRLQPPPVPLAPFCSVSRQAKLAGQLRLVFISRISAMKNLEFVLEILRSYQMPVQFEIFGPVQPSDEAYWQHCQSLIKALPQNISVSYKGPIDASAVSAEFIQHDLFVLPTRGENFGFAIIESLAAGCPILISDQTTWNEIPSEAGTAIALSDKAAWTNSLLKIQNLNEKEWSLRSESARAYAETVSRELADFMKLYR